MPLLYAARHRRWLAGPVRCGTASSYESPEFPEKCNAPSCRLLFAILGPGLNSIISTAGTIEAWRRMEGYSELIQMKATGHLAVPTRMFVRARGSSVLAPGHVRG